MLGTDSVSKGIWTRKCTNPSLKGLHMSAEIEPTMKPATYDDTVPVVMSVVAFVQLGP